MKSVVREHGAEALTGLLVVLLAAWFAWFAWERTGGGGASNAIRVTAIFPNATGISVGTDVRIAGLKVGTVTEQALNPESYQVDVTLALDPTVKIPKDSSAVISSEGLLGGSYIALQPGGDSATLKNGDTIVDTQGAIDMMGLIGQFINKSGGDAPATADEPASGK